jgi:flagellin-like protein
MLILGSYVLNKHLKNGKEEVQANLPKILKSKRGISPILATLLLIVIAVAAIIITYAWVMTFMGAQTTAGGTILDVENVNWNSTASTASIVIKNIGTSDANIVRLYVGVSPTDLDPVTAYTDLGGGKFLPIGGTVTVVLTWPNALETSWTAGRTYYFRVAPETGNPKDFTWKAS